ncbi:MAG: hypothetical protein DSY43_04440, partial [Gammaproteobacteria bacterium]
RELITHLSPLGNYGNEVQHQLTFPDSRQHEVSETFLGSRRDVVDDVAECELGQSGVFLDPEYEPVESQPTQCNRAFFESQHEADSQPNQHGGSFPEPQNDQSELGQIKREIEQIWATLKSNPRSNDERLQSLERENRNMLETIGNLQQQISNVTEERNSLRLALKIMARECTSSSNDNNGPNVLITRANQANSQSLNTAKDRSHPLTESVMVASSNPSSSNKKTKKQKKKKAKGTSDDSTNPQLPQSKNIQSSCGSGVTTSKPITVICGDSIIQPIRGWDLSSSTKVVVKSFSGATTEDMEDFIKPILRKEPENVILHVGTNDVLSLGPKMTADGIINIARQIEEESPTTSISISGLIVRKADGNNSTATTNNYLTQACRKFHWNFINNDNITLDHLNRGGLHLIKSGSSLLAKNFKSFINRD